MKNAAFHTLGCKVNSYETEVMMQKLQEKGYHIVPFDEAADVYIVNTCTVTNIADRKSRQMLHRARQKNPDAVVVAAGCYAQTGADSMEKDDSVDLIIGTDCGDPGEISGAAGGKPFIFGRLRGRRAGGQDAGRLHADGHRPYIPV